MSKNFRNSFEDWFIDRLSDKIEFQKPIAQVVWEFMNQRNRRWLLLSISWNKEICNYLKIPELKRKLLRRKANSLYTKEVEKSWVDMSNEDELHEFLDSYDESEACVVEHFDRDFQQFWYERRTSTYTPKAALEEKFLSYQTWKMDAEETIMNRIIEWILWKVLQEQLRSHPILWSEYDIRITNTSTFDDVISWTDLIVRARNRYTWQYSNYAIDVACTNSLQYIEKKERWSSSVICGEFWSTLWEHWSYRRMPRLVFAVSPWIIAKAVDQYIDTLLNKWWFSSTSWVADMFNTIEKHSYDERMKFEQWWASRVDLAWDLLSILDATNA